MAQSPDDNQLRRWLDQLQSFLHLVEQRVHVRRVIVTVVFAGGTHPVNDHGRRPHEAKELT